MESGEDATAATKTESGDEGAPESDTSAPDTSEPAPPDLAASVAVAESTDEEVAYQTYLDRVGVEIQRTLATTQLEVPIDLICLTGVMSRREEAVRYFEESFDLETVRLAGIALAGSAGTYEAILQYASNLRDSRLFQSVTLLQAAGSGRQDLGFTVIASIPQNSEEEDVSSP